MRLEHWVMAAATFWVVVLAARLIIALWNDR